MTAIIRNSRVRNETTMNQSNSELIIKKILEENGGRIADKAKKILLEDPALEELHEPLTFIKENWRDLTPAMMRLSCEAVGGKPEETNDAALALSLMNLSFTIWDDIIDSAPYKMFRPTVFGKFGQGMTIIVGGIATAKAFTIINESKIENSKRIKISRSVWKLWAKMASEEAITVRTRNEGCV